MWKKSWRNWMRLEREFEKLQEEMSKFRLETRQRLEVIENEVSKQVALNYNRAIIDYVSENTEETITGLKCEQGEEKEQFCKNMLANVQGKYLEFLKKGRINDSIKALDEALFNVKKFEKVSVEEGRIGCLQCFGNQLKVIENNKMLLSQLQLIESPIASISDNRSTIGEIDPIQLNNQLLSPLASETRLQILISVFLGENRFTDFVKTTGQSGGQLLYHLRILLRNGFITQYESKDYVLTRKGIKALITLAQLSNELTN